MERTAHQVRGDPQQPATVVIVQQPVVVSNGTFVPGQPFLRRGVKLNNGTKIGGRCISTLGVTGATLTFMGLIFMIVGPSVFMGILFMLVGGGLLAACFKFCHKAKQDYDALPQDHPDRVIYSTPVFRPHRRGGASFPVTTTATYQLPPGTQVFNTSTAHGNPFLANCQIPQGSQIIDSSGIMPYPRGSIHLSQYPGVGATVIPPQQVSPAEDKPPSYDEVCKASSNQ